MTSAATQDRSDVLFEEVGLRVASIASSEPVAWAATSALEHGGLVIDSRYLGSGSAAAERLAADTDVVLIVEDGPELETVVRAARLRAPDAGIVVVVPVATRTETRGLLAVGADAVVVDAERREVLPAAVRCAAVGQISIPRALRDVLERPALSHGELQIVALAAADCTNAQIAERLCLAESTVKARFSSVFRRLGVRSRRQAVAAVVASDDVFHRSVLASIGPIAPALRAARRGDGTDGAASGTPRFDREGHVPPAG
jgi:DNA-binding NarL/FixJ family response regulator